MKEEAIEHHCRPSDWMQGAIGIVCLPVGQGQLDGGWHIVFWQSETRWDRSLAVEFCPYCGLDLERVIGGRTLGARLKRLLSKLLPELP
jgi:hypothetical protein